MSMADPDNRNQEFDPGPSTGPNLNDYSSWNGDWRGYMEHLASNGDPVALDNLFKVFTEDDSRRWTEEREDTQYRRLMRDLAGAGINPYILMNSGATPISSSRGGLSGSSYATYSVNKEKNEQNWLKMFLATIPIFVSMIALAAV